MSLAQDTNKTEFAKSVRDVPRRPIPVIDVGKARLSDLDAVEAVAGQWRDVWENLGFLAIVNHGLEPELIDGMTEAAKRFHDLPLETKMQVRITDDQKGYNPAKTTISPASKFHKSKTPTTVECLVLATDYPADHPDVRAGKRFYGPNPWLPEDVLPGFRATATNYMARITELGKSMLPVWARSLELEADFFAPYFVNSYTYFRVAKYARKPDLDDGELGANAHCDTGFSTYLPPAREPGLQILDADNKTWFWPEVPEDAVIVNMGYFFERWTNKRFRATPHRVVPPTENDRYSLACFVSPSFDTIGETLPTCVGPDNPPRHEPLNHWEYFDSYYQKNRYLIPPAESSS
ncbi:MAG: 2-oxoglutarate and iron-dependent oxygenase domain-containing protein [Alphaproteobacteria bacterium]